MQIQNILLTIDKISTFIGQAFSWLIVSLTFMITWEVISRYAFDNPHPWAFDVMIMMYGSVFMMAGAYTLSKNGHVRGDVLYGFFSPRVQASLDLLLYFLFFIPGVFALAWAGYNFAGEAWAINEHSNVTADGPPVYPFKTILPVAGAFLLLQGVVEIIRCVICIREGEWPSREQDVEEVDVEKLKEMVHVKDEDIAALDRFVVAQEGAHSSAHGGAAK
ncbi:TRAP transporter small permease subunit [Sulfuritalea sp.]|uniref:TRAP transporter small permease subunit n=1 Tax=Sulfuritalea sp. TaxID=2480090 RepID=UPI00286E1FEB|nr:TRAP transporter small permease subunit [Sulfuritalea sp.]